MKLSLCVKKAFPHLTTEENFSFSRHTTIGCGGTAALAAFPATKEELVQLLAFCNENAVPHCFLGAGANVLPADGYFDGIVIRFQRFRGLFLTDGGLYAGAGVTGGALTKFARKHALGGFECFTGIPMTVGGAVVMNAGIREGHACDLVIAVTACTANSVHVFSLKECGFSEKSSIFQSNYAVTGVLFRAESAHQEEIAARRECFRARRTLLPKGRSMGCVFKNPKGDFAGRIIESCGLKGARIGGAYISMQHANFIINEGGTATDVAMLIDRVKEQVKQMTGIMLQEEIRRIAGSDT